MVKSTHKALGLSSGLDQYVYQFADAASEINRLERQDIYLDDMDRQDFLKTFAEACQKTGWQIDAYCRMTNNPAGSEC
jgi:hypothetical protein